ncbi:MAG: hypothetical protein ABL961_18770, partial [Vicinamibacterales bacterium]
MQVDEEEGAKLLAASGATHAAAPTTTVVEHTSDHTYRAVGAPTAGKHTRTNDAPLAGAEIFKRALS